jgi:response regulator RpfG family c-di-GMP phosphodiesterase
LGRSTCVANVIPSEPPVSVLLVEDEPLIREFVVEALRDAGYHVIHASTGEEALDLCKRHVADVLVTDVRLPGNIDGWQIAERCRESDPELPVLRHGLLARCTSPRAGQPHSEQTLPSGRRRPHGEELGGQKGMPPN